MKKRAISCFILLTLISCFVNAQEAYIKYSVQINKAELCVSNNDFSGALLYYDNALKEKNNLFAKDAYNAAVCAAILKNEPKCYMYLQSLIDIGFKMKVIKSTEVFDSFLRTKYGKKLIKYSDTVKFKYNLKLRASIDSLNYMDQLFRLKPGKYITYEDTIRKIDAGNARFLSNLIINYGFPSEKLIGIAENFPGGKPPYYAILMHQQNGSRFSVMNYGSILKEALTKGEIEPDFAVEMIDKSEGSDAYGVEVCGLVKYVLDSISTAAMQYSNPDSNYDSVKWGYFNLSEKSLYRINTNRNSIGLGTIEDCRKKAAYQKLEDERFQMGTYSIYVFDKKEEYKQALKNVTLIK